MYDEDVVDSEKNSSDSLIAKALGYVSIVGLVVIYILNY